MDVARCSWHGVGNDPTYNSEGAFETFPFPDGLTPNIPAAATAGDPRAIRIAAAAQRLDALRRAWLNPADLVVIEPEVVPTAAPGEAPVSYPDRILPRDARAAAELKKRTLTNLYNLRPTWLVGRPRRARPRRRRRLWLAGGHRHRAGAGRAARAQPRPCRHRCAGPRRARAGRGRRVMLGLHPEGLTFRS